MIGSIQLTRAHAAGSRVFERGPVRASAGATLLLLASAACGAAPASTPATTPAAPDEVSAAAPPPMPPASEVRPAPRLTVEAPFDLGAAITARLPTIEIVPLSCGLSREAVAVTNERVCLQDPETGLSRAVRRFSTSYDPSVSAARFGDDVVFSVLDLGMNRTRYTGHLWRWTLGDDRYVGLAHLEDEALLYGGAHLQALDFGILIRVADPSGEASVPRLFDGELRRLRSVDEDIGTLVVAEGHAYEHHRVRQREALGAVRLDGPRVVVDPIASYPRAWHLPLAVHFPEGRALVVSAFPRGEQTSVYVVEPPATEVRELTVAIARPVEARFDHGRFLLRSEAGWAEVDLSTGAHTLVEPTAPPADAPRPASRSIHAIALEPDAVTLVYSDGALRLSASGVESRSEPPTSVPAGCRCEDDALICGADTIAGACTEVPELDRLRGGDDGLETASSLYSPRYRVDRLEPDLTRITRLSDGARLWVRVFDGGVLAQADDGAFVMPDPLESAGFALRWGRSLLAAPLTELGPHRAAFSRPSLVEDFFAGRPLPAADTTLPER